MATPAPPLSARLSAPLALQLVLLAVLPAVLATIGVLLVVTRQYLAEVESITRNHAQTVALQVATWAETPMAQVDRRALMRIARSGTAQAHIQQVQIWSAEGELLAESGVEAAGQPQGLQVIAPILSDRAQKSGQVMIEVSLDGLRAAERKVWLTVIAAFGTTLLGVALAGAWAVKRISDPIGKLAAAVDRLGAGEDVRVDVGGAPEVRHLQTGFNAAAAALGDSRRLLEYRIQEATAELAQKNREVERASQAKTRLLAAASHDLRQPLHALTLFSEGLASGETDPVRLQRIGHVRECVESLDSLFSELLNISQIDAGVLKPQWSDFALDRLFDDLSRNFRPVAESQELRLVVRHTDVWVHSDYYMLSRIVSNLVANSLRHTKTGGVLVGARRRGLQVRIDVVDTGIGIPLEHQAQVFEEFYQIEDKPAGKGRGMGLGLATVQRLAGLLGATIQLSSQPERGTCVRVSVASATAPRPAPAALGAPAGFADARLDGLRVLVVDDEPTILEGLQVALSVWGADVVTAQNTRQACELANIWKSPPDVVITDLWLDGDETGLAVLQALQDHPRGIRHGTVRLIVTGETKPDRLKEAAASGVPIFHKPVTLQVLRQAISEQLRERART